jgi:hypothetical protein
VLDRLFERCVVEKKLPELFSAVIERLCKIGPHGPSFIFLAAQ